MAKQNFFSGVKMTAATVSAYYKNPAYPNFDHFVFQPMIDDGSAANDNFTLAAYAVDKYLKVLNNGNPLPVNELNNNYLGTKPNIQFANMKLDLTALADLYPAGVTSELRAYPPGGYYYQNGVETAYVLYVAETKHAENVVVTKPINPSPPF